jgi:hypothetical protein
MELAQLLNIFELYVHQNYRDLTAVTVRTVTPPSAQVVVMGSLGSDVLHS